MFFTQVEQTDQFLVHVRAGEATLTGATRVVGFGERGELDFSEQLANRAQVKLSLVRTVVIELPEDEAVALRAAIGAGAVDVQIAYLWEDESPLGTYTVQAATLTTPPEGEVGVALATEQVRFS